ncbi:tRNA (adenosine(37)-N6)-threonylcarbamoyltransferase complex dimerization subunit type 1 TsaB [Bordetella sp. 2513F-2]
MNRNLLAFETSSPRCGVALLREAGAAPRITLREHDGAQEHAERLLPMARALLDDAGLRPADVHAVAFGQGPGGFTGLRVACGVAQGVALGLGVPVVPVVSHLAVAEAAQPAEGDAVLVALDARMEEVYLAAYARGSSGAWQTLQSPLLVPAAEVLPWSGSRLAAWRAAAGRPLDLLLAGDAWDAYPALAGAQEHRRAVQAVRPGAAAVAQLAWQAWQRGETVDPASAAPLYVRDKVAYTTAERQLGQGGNPRAGSTLVRPVLAPMTPADLDQVAALEADVQAFPWTRGNFADALAAGYPACVLRLDGRVVGFCVLMAAPDVAHVLVLAVARAHQRQGLGRQLLDWCERQAAGRGSGGLLLEVRPSNTTALRFYERLGFLRAGVRRGYYPAGAGQREDALVMQKPLVPGAPA